MEVAVQSLDRAELIQAHRIAYRILDKMAPKKREVFILAEFEALSCEEIAEIVDTKTETVWSRLHYARKDFSERLAKLSPSRRAMTAERDPARAIIEQAKKSEVVVPRRMRVSVYGGGLNVSDRADRTTSRMGHVSRGCNGGATFRRDVAITPHRHACDGARRREKIAIVADETLPKFTSPTLVDINGAAKMVVGPDSIMQLARLDADGIVVQLQSGGALYAFCRAGRTRLFGSKRRALRRKSSARSCASR